MICCIWGNCSRYRVSSAAVAKTVGPTVDKYLECRFSQRGLSRTEMGPDAVAACDSEARAGLDDQCRWGTLAHADASMELSVTSRVVWGINRPVTTGR